MKFGPHVGRPPCLTTTADVPCLDPSLGHLTAGSEYRAEGGSFVLAKACANVSTSAETGLFVDQHLHVARVTEAVIEGVVVSIGDRLVE